MKIIANKTIAIGAGIFLAATLAVNAFTVYNNTSTDSGYSLNFTNGWTIGNEIVLGNGYSSASLTNFSFEIYSTLASFTGSVQMQVFLYANDGTPPFNGYDTPGSVLYDSGLFTLLTPQQYVNTNAVVLNFDLTSSPVNILTSNFTFAAVVTGLATSDTVGFEIFTNGTVGQNFSDYWRNDGSSWALLTNSAPTSIGAQFQATPEPSTLCLAFIGGSCLIGSAWRRRQAQAKQP